MIRGGVETRLRGPLRRSCKASQIFQRTVRSRGWTLSQDHRVCFIWCANTERWRPLYKTGAIFLYIIEEIPAALHFYRLLSDRRMGFANMSKMQLVIVSDWIRYCLYTVWVESTVPRHQWFYCVLVSSESFVCLQLLQGSDVRWNVRSSGMELQKTTTWVIFSAIALGGCFYAMEFASLTPSLQAWNEGKQQQVIFYLLLFLSCCPSLLLAAIKATCLLKDSISRGNTFFFMIDQYI